VHPSTATIRQRFFDAPRAGVLAGANAIGEAGSLAVGEAQRLMLKIDPRTDTVEDARAQTFGGSSAIAVASAVTELVIGRTVERAAAIGVREIRALLASLPPEGVRSSVLGREALTAALASWRGTPAPRADGEGGALVCRCRAVRAATIERAIRHHGLTSVADVTRHTGAGSRCSCCQEAIEGLLAGTGTRSALPNLDPKRPGRRAFVHPALAHQPPPKPITIQLAPATPDGVPKAAGSAVREAILIARLIERARPSIRADGGDVELVDYADSTVFVRLSGVCAGCSAAPLTLGGLRQTIVQALGRPVRVVPVARS
jgi:NifU-like protein